MGDYQNKISELPVKATVGENDYLPIADNANTNKIKLNQLRSTINFDNAFNTLQEGIAASAIDDVFYVFTDNDHNSVNEYVATSGGAIQVVDESNTPVVRMTAKGISTLRNIRTIADLRKRGPYYTGEIVTVKGYDKDTPEGGGNFVARSGKVIDDGGHLITSSDTWYWERIANEVNLLHYGIKVSSRESGKEVYYDVSDAMQAAATRAAAKSLPLVSSATFSGDPGNDAYPRWGYYITKTWDITNVKNLVGQFNILAKGSAIASNGLIPIGGTTPYCVVSLNCSWGTNGKIFGTTYGNIVVDKLNVFNVDGYNPNQAVNGVLMIASGSRFNFMQATNFNGRALHFADCYDNIFGDTRVLWSGNENTFALDVTAWKADSTSSSDESNSNTFLGVMAHNCREKSWRIAGTKTNVVRVHDEALLSTTATPSQASPIEKRNGYGYTSCYFSSIGGHLGSVSFSTFDKASTVTPVFTLGSAVNCSADNIASTTDGANVSVISGDPGPSGAASLASVTCKEFRTSANARTTISSIRCVTATLVDPSSPIQAGTITGDLNLMSSTEWPTLKDLRIGGNANINTAALFINCTFSGPLNINSDAWSTVTNRMRHVFEHCMIKAEITSDTSRVVFRECNATSNKAFTIQGAGEGVRIENSRISMPITVAGKSTLDIVDSDMAGTTVATSSDGTITVSNGNWNTGTITSTGTGQVIVRDGSNIKNIVGATNVRITDSTVAGPMILGDNSRMWVVGSTVGDLTLSGTGLTLDCSRTSFNRFAFDTTKTNTGVWRVASDCVAFTSVNWVVPTVTSGYGVRTYDMLTSTLYKVVGNAWVKVTETTA